MFNDIKITDIYLSNNDNIQNFEAVTDLLNFSLTSNKPTFINGEANLIMTFTPILSANSLTVHKVYPVCVNITFSNGMILSFGAKRGITNTDSKIIYTIQA